LNIISSPKSFFDTNDVSVATLGVKGLLLTLLKL